MVYLQKYAILLPYEALVTPYAWLGSFYYRKVINVQYKGVHGINSAYEIISYEELHVDR